MDYKMKCLYTMVNCANWFWNKIQFAWRNYGPLTTEHHSVTISISIMMQKLQVSIATLTFRTERLLLFMTHCLGAMIICEFAILVIRQINYLDNIHIINNCTKFQVILTYEQTIIILQKIRVTLYDRYYSFLVIVSQKDHHPIFISYQLGNKSYKVTVPS